MSSQFRPTLLGPRIALGRFSLVLHPRALWVTGIMLVLVVALGAVSLGLGTMQIPLAEVFRSLADTEAEHHRIITGIRLPRALTATFAGAALGLSGAIFQSVSRNALGSPDVIGFTTGSATGAIAMIVVFEANGAQVALGAVFGGLFTAVAVYLLALRGGVSGGYRLVLVGIGVGAVLSALNGLLLVKGKLDSAVTANLWLSGSLDARDWAEAVPVMVGTLIALPMTAMLARRLSLSEMGDDLANGLGVRVERTRLVAIATAVVLAAVATGSVGPIAFIALAAPQLAVRLTGLRSMPTVSSAVVGALLLTVADLVTRLLPMTITVPIGRMTGIVGGLYLIWLLTRSRQV